MRNFIFFELFLKNPITNQKEIEELQAKLLKEQKQVAALEASVQNLKSENSEISSIKKELEEIKKVLGMEASLKNKK